MAYLLDTQILIWILESNKRLSASQLEIILDPNKTKFVSHVSFMEIAIKFKLNKLPEVIVDVENLIVEAKKVGLKILPLNQSHISAYTSIPLFNEHRDPFDRFLLAISQVENFPILSSDEKFILYKDLIEVIN
jgi:PIN domain nuclease of toxin-antitoxin system